MFYILNTERLVRWISCHYLLENRSYLQRRMVTFRFIHVVYLIELLVPEIWSRHDWYNFPHNLTLSHLCSFKVVAIIQLNNEYRFIDTSVPVASVPPQCAFDSFNLNDLLLDRRKEITNTDVGCQLASAFRGIGSHQNAPNRSNGYSLRELFSGNEMNWNRKSQPRSTRCSCGPLTAERETGFGASKNCPTRRRHRISGPWID